MDSQRDKDELNQDEPDSEEAFLNDEAAELWRRGNHRLRNGDYESAEEFFRAILADTPDYVPAVNKLGVALAEQGETDGARECFERALILDEEYPAALSNLGNVHLTAGEVDHAMEYYERALAIDPKYATARNNLAAAYKRKGDIGAFVREYKQAQRDRVHERLEVGDKESKERVKGGCRGQAGAAVLVLSLIILLLALI